MNVLVIDDDPGVNIVLTKWLTCWGHQVQVATSGEEGLRLFEQGDFQVVFTDWLMPSLSGLEICRRIRACKRARYVYLVIITVLGGKASCVEGLEAGADDFMTKPLHPEELRLRLGVGQRVLALQDEMSRLKGMLAICAHCKKIRDDGQWVPVDQFVARHTDASFSHGLCDGCLQVHYPED